MLSQPVVEVQHRLRAAGVSEAIVAGREWETDLYALTGDLSLEEALSSGSFTTDRFVECILSRLSADAYEPRSSMQPGGLGDHNQMSSNGAPKRPPSGGANANEGKRQNMAMPELPHTLVATAPTAGSSLSLASIFTAPTAVLGAHLKRFARVALKSDEPSSDQLLQQMQQPDEQIVNAVTEYESGGESAINNRSVLDMLSGDNTEEADLSTSLIGQVSQGLIVGLIHAAATPMTLLTGGAMDTGLAGMLKPIRFVPGDDEQTDPPPEVQQLRERLSDDALRKVFAAYDGEKGSGAKYPVDVWVASDFTALGITTEELPLLSDHILYSVPPVASFKSKELTTSTLEGCHKGLSDLQPGGNAKVYRRTFLCKIRTVLSPALPADFVNNDARIEAATREADHATSGTLLVTIHDYATDQLLRKVAGIAAARTTVGGNAEDNYTADDIGSYGDEGRPDRKIGTGDDDYAFRIKIFTHGLDAFEALVVPADGPARLEALKQQAAALAQQVRSTSQSDGSVRVRTVVNGVPSETDYEDFTSLGKAVSDRKCPATMKVDGERRNIKTSDVRDAPGGRLILHQPRKKVTVSVEFI